MPDPMSTDRTDDMRAANAWPIRIGGLLRCCIASVRESELLSREGDTRECMVGQGCMTQVVLRDGAWEWNLIEKWGLDA